MPKISNQDIYNQDDTLSMNDYTIGSNSNTGNKKTQTYTFASIFSLFYNFLGYNAFLNTTDTTTYPIGTPGCFYVFDENDEFTTDFSESRKITFSSYDTYNFDTANYFNIIVSSNKFLFKLINLEDKNNFIFLKPSNFVLSGPGTTFDVNVLAESGLSNGSFVNYKRYLLVLEFAAGTFNPADYDLTDFTNTSGNPFITAQDLTDALSLLPAPITNHSGLSLDDGTNPHGTTKQDVGLGDVPNLNTTEAVNKAHEHTNFSVLNGTEESFTTALKNAYNSAVSWITTNGTNLINHLTNYSNPHSVTKSQVGLGSVDNTSDADKPISNATQGALNNKADLVGGKVPAEQLPSYVDDVLEFANLAAFPVTGETSKIYLALDNNKTYRWSGSAYVQLSGGIDFPSDGKTYGAKDGVAVRVEEHDFFNPYTSDYFIGTIRPQGQGLTSFLLTGVLNSWITTGTLEAFSDSTEFTLVGLKTTSATAGSSLQLTNSSQTARSRFYTNPKKNKAIHRFIFRNSDDVAVANARFFVGLYAGNSIPIGNVNPSTLINCIGFGADSGDTNIHLIHNDELGVATKVDLGVNFPANTQNVDTYVAYFFIDKHNNKLYARLERLNTGYDTGVLEVTTDIFAINRNLDPHIWRNNGTTSLEVKMRVGSYLAAQKMM